MRHLPHAHRCDDCGRTWHHDPRPWRNRLTESQVLDEHTCCGQLWLDPWPLPFPASLLGARLYCAIARPVRLARHVLAFVAGALVQLAHPRNEPS